jgi:hypothetical protein
MEGQQLLLWILFFGHFLWQREFSKKFTTLSHEDVNRLFGQWSMKLGENNYLNLPHLIKSFMEPKSAHVMPHLFEEVPDLKFFKTICCLVDIDLLGIWKVNNKATQYRIKNTKSEWKSVEGIALWCCDDNGKSMLPIKKPFACPKIPMRVSAINPHFYAS